MVNYSCNAENVRALAISNAREEWNSGSKDTWPVPWKGTTESFPIVKVALENLALNHRSHRIRAQLEDLPAAQEALAQPDGDDAQEYIAIAIVDSSENFGELSENLARLGQDKPGVITRAGVIVNGNRRAVALRDIGEKWMKVALLPAGVTSNDMDDLEFDLQIKKDLKEGYTFTNRLIVINELLERRKVGPEEIGLRLGWAGSAEDAELKKGANRVEGAIRVLSTIRTLQDLAMQGGHLVPLSYFDDKQQSLEELDKFIIKLEEEGADFAEIESVRTLRLIGMFSGLTKVQLRKIKTNFRDEFLEPRLADEDAESIREMLTEPPDNPPDAIPGLGGTEGQSPAEDVSPKLLQLLATSVGLDSAEAPGSDEALPPEVCNKVAEVLSDAVEVATSQTSRANRLRAPTESLRKARSAMRVARNKLVKVLSESRFKVGDFEYQLNKLEKDIEEIRCVLESGDSIVS